MRYEAHTEQGSVLRPDQFALVAGMDGGVVFYMPNLPAGTAVPRSVQLLTAVAAKIDDEDWVEEMIRELHQLR